MAIFKQAKKKKITKKDSVEEAAEKFYTRTFSEERLKFRQIVRSSSFSMFVYSVIFINTVLIAAGTRVCSLEMLELASVQETAL